MSQIDVLIGSNLPLYTEVLASAFAARRPDLSVRSTLQDDLDALVRELKPLLVICTLVSQTIADMSPAWISLFPDDRDEALVSIGGSRRTIPGATIAELLDIVDIVKTSKR